MGDDGRFAIRSYRMCFSLERRIHRVDRWRIPVPFGVPLRGIGYAAALLIAMLMLGHLPILGPAVTAIDPAIRLVVAPCCGAYLLYLWEIDGRPAHVALASMARLHLGPRRIAGFRRAPRPGTEVRLGDVALAPDESSIRMRRGTVRGPATVVLRYPFRPRASGSALRVSQEPGAARWRGRQVTLRSGQRMVTR
ncbi:MAG: hypothetical protein JSS97_05430 [Actinobacteria bacterium]|nr:hypothetical protein [Actinomycetota bacterium]